VPLYEYVCQECQHDFEALVFNGEAVTCSKCESEKVERKLSVPARPKTESASLPTACNSSGPPCGPVCGRWKG
jgi:putative FmdB family regulatory protein